MLDYQDSITRLQQMTGQIGKRAGRFLMYHCPCHNDPGASLGVSRYSRNPDKAIFTCFAGCDYKAIEAAIGLGHRYIYDTPEPVQRTLVAKYTYTNQYGAPLYRKLRYDPKAFSLQTYIKGQWENCAPTTPVLYRLPELVHSDTVFVLEGEKGVNALRDWGLVGTCSYNGASKSQQQPKWQPALYNQWFTGKRVILLPDNDAAGLAHMQFIYSTLTDVVSKQLVQLPGLAAKQDFYDWQALGWTLAELHSLLV